MNILLADLFEKTDIYLLIVVRLLGFFAIMPIFSGRNVPNITKVGLSVIIAGIILVIGTLSASGFGVLDHIKLLGMDILDFLDFITNSIMMPIAAISTCVLILSVVGMNKIAEEVEISSKFKRKKLYFVFLKYFAIACLVIVLISSIANVLGFIKI